MKNSHFLLFLLLLANSCSNPKHPDEYEKIEVFYQQFKKGNLEQYNKIIVINEEGTCLNCNNIFARNQAEKINKTTNLFIVSGRGTRVDISAYISKNAPNLILDHTNEFSRLNLVKGCAIIELENKKIKTITPIDAQNIQKLKLQN
ncbi:hypothetical protein D3C71_852660 [compost metagenome]